MIVHMAGEWQAPVKPPRAVVGLLGQSRSRAGFCVHVIQDVCYRLFLRACPRALATLDMEVSCSARDVGHCSAEVAPPLACV